jgi:DNA-directed RNA polymerase subunit RPC12/RpoP
MINYCCSRCGEKVPVKYSYQVDVSVLDFEMLRRTKSYILCLACSVELESWMEEDEKENNNEHN